MNFFLNYHLTLFLVVGLCYFCNCTNGKNLDSDHFRLNSSRAINKFKPKKSANSTLTNILLLKDLESSTIVYLNDWDKLNSISKHLEDEYLSSPVIDYMNNLLKPQKKNEINKKKMSANKNKKLNKLGKVYKKSKCL